MPKPTMQQQRTIEALISAHGEDAEVNCAMPPVNCSQPTGNPSSVLSKLMAVAESRGAQIKEAHLKGAWWVCRQW